MGLMIEEKERVIKNSNEYPNLLSKLNCVKQDLQYRHKFQFVELRKSKFEEAEMDKYNELKEKFEANRNDENATKMAAYMRNLFAFYGLPTPKRKSIYKEFLRAEKTKKVVDWDLLDRCYADEHREFHYFVMDYLVAMQKFLTYDDVPHIKKYIKTNQWWDTIDGLDRIVGNIAFLTRE